MSESADILRQIGKSYRLYGFINLDYQILTINRSAIFKKLLSLNVPCSSGSCPEIYLEKAFSNYFKKTKRLKNAKQSGETSIAFLVHPNLTKKNLKEIANITASVFNEFF